jgi:hypothetical protein
MDLFAHRIPSSVKFSFHFRLPSFIVLPVIADDRDLITIRPKVILSFLETDEISGYK